jgi:hypothetical protein
MPGAGQQVRCPALITKYLKRRVKLDRDGFSGTVIDAVEFILTALNPETKMFGNNPGLPCARCINPIGTERYAEPAIVTGVGYSNTVFAEGIAEAARRLFHLYV